MKREKLEELLRSSRSSLTEEQMEKIKARQTPREMLAPAGGKRIELPDDMLDAVTGGSEPVAVEKPAAAKKPAIKRKEVVDRH